MAETDIDLNAPEFTPIRGQLARAFLANKATWAWAMPATNGSPRMSM